MTVKGVEGEWVRVMLDDTSERRLALDSLLAVDEDGAGVNYRFQGWKPRPRGYRTAIRVAAVDADAGTCRLVLPEWDAATEVEELLSALPPAMRTVGAGGSCMANLASPSAAGLAIHACRSTKVRGLSRASLGAHPEHVAVGQEFRRLRDGTSLRILTVDTRSATVSAWNGKRRVRIDRAKLLARGQNGAGLHYFYLGGGVREARRRRQAPSAP